jgi:hypothetical protein
MAEPRPFQLITSAPTDTAVEVIYGAPRSVALAARSFRCGSKSMIRIAGPCIV